MEQTSQINNSIPQASTLGKVGIGEGGSLNNADTRVLIPGKGGAHEAGVPSLLPGEAYGVDVGVGMGQARRHRLPPGHRFFDDCAREQCARWLDWAMHLEGECWFSTITFRDYTSVYRAGKMAGRWLARMNQAHKDITAGRQLKSFCATEWQQRDVIHYHLLILGAGLGALSRKRWEHRWGVNGGGFARNYDAVMKAAPYLAKYMNKRLGGELNIGGAWRGTKPPTSISRCCRGGQQEL